MKGAENGAQLGLDIGRVASFANEKVDFLFRAPAKVQCDWQNRRGVSSSNFSMPVMATG